MDPFAPDITDFKRIVFFTGAGVSKESGIPTFRGDGGIWNEYKPEDIASQEAFDKDPVRVWDFNNKRREMVAKCDPNLAHRLISQCERELDAEITVVTQNIDGLHSLAGSTTVHELHGSLWRVRHKHSFGNEPTEYLTNRDVPFASERDDGAHWRPDIVWFGDQLDPDVVNAALTAIENCDLIVCVGTSAMVFPAAMFPGQAPDLAVKIEINPEETDLTLQMTHFMQGAATEQMALLCRNLGVDKEAVREAQEII